MFAFFALVGVELVAGEREGGVGVEVGEGVLEQPALDGPVGLGAGERSGEAVIDGVAVSLGGAS